ncbi:MAG: hypothetical protein OXH69_08415 [Acidobacteria bacterium]|nr:hypothetical protein [Acidobacteriota bacterium]
MRVRHVPALPYREVSAAIVTLHDSRGWVGAKLVFEFQAAPRWRGGGPPATRDEFDLGAMKWTIPDTRM